MKRIPKFKDYELFNIVMAEYFAQKATGESGYEMHYYDINNENFDTDDTFDKKVERVSKELDFSVLEEMEEEDYESFNETRKQLIDEICDALGEYLDC